MSKKKEYIDNLVNQYIEATSNLEGIDLNSESDLDEFSVWLHERQKIAKQYISFLNYLELKFGYSYCAEVGKGKFDSVVKKFDTGIITPYGSTLDNISKGRLIIADFEVVENTPYIYRGSRKVSIPPHVFSTLMTQNAKDEEILDWEKLHNSEEYGIIVGAYGSIHDKDITKKIRRINDFKDKLYDNDNLVYEYVTTDDSYLVVAATKDRVLEKIKVK